MPFYFLRHEHRDKHDFMFRSPLNLEGRENAQTLLRGHLSMLQLDAVYSSPFIRTLQTITPAINTYYRNLKINPEYAIAEYIHDKAFEKYTPQDFVLSQQDYREFPINQRYQSLFDVNNLRYKETVKQLNQRTQVFANYMREKYDADKDSVLICSHRSTLVSLINNLYHQLNVPDNDGYGMGKLATVIDIHGTQKLTFLN